MKTLCLVLAVVSLSTFAWEVPNTRLQKKRAEDAKKHEQPGPAPVVGVPGAPAAPPVYLPRPEMPLSPAFFSPSKDEIEFPVGLLDAIKADSLENGRYALCRGKDKDNEEVFVHLDLTDGKPATQVKEGKKIAYRDLKTIKIRVWNQQDGYFHEFSPTPVETFVIGLPGYELNEEPKGVKIRAHVGENFKYLGLRMTLEPLTREIELDCEIYQAAPCMEQLLKQRFIRRIPEGQAAEPRKTRAFEDYKHFHFIDGHLKLEHLGRWIEEALKEECQVFIRGNGSIDEAFIVNEKTNRAVGKMMTDYKQERAYTTTVYRKAHYSGNFSSGAGIEWILKQDTLDSSETLRSTGRDPKLVCSREQNRLNRDRELHWKCRCDGKQYAFPLAEGDLEFWKCIDRVVVQPAIRSVCR